MKNKEEKIIEKSQTQLKLLQNSYKNDEHIVIEYGKLLDEYKKLSKRFEKTLKINDTNGKNILKTSETLKENVDYTIKKAKEKLFNNVIENRKLKELHSTKVHEANEIIKRLKLELKKAQLRIIDLEQMELKEI